MAIDNLAGIMEGPDVEVRPGDVARAVLEIAFSTVKKGVGFIEEHPTETRIALMATIGAIAMLAPEVARAQSPSATPIPPELQPIPPEAIKGAVEVLTGGKQPATGMVTGLVTALDYTAKYGVTRC